MTATVSKVTAFAVIAPPGGAIVSKVTAFAILTDTPPTTGAGSENDPIVRVWGFSMDGHDFYVIRLGASETLVYDLTTGQWHHWASPDEERWRAHIGNNWVGIGATTTDRDFGSDVVAGDDRSGTLWMLDPTAGVDDNDTTGTSSFIRKVTGGISLRGRDVLPCNAVQLTLSLGEPVLSGATLTLNTSDDFGKTWVNQGTVEIDPGNYDQVIEYRSLGLMVQPGRIFEITDEGACVRISGADLR
jgi:hypothetical protein